jgi:hypothetical protein
MTEADKERIAQIYVGQDWRALAKGSANSWYAVSHAASEQAAVDQVLEACRACCTRSEISGSTSASLRSIAVRAARRHR